MSVDNIQPSPHVSAAVLTVDQFARVMQLSPATVRRLNASGRLPIQPLRIGRRLLFSAQAVELFLAANTTSQNHTN